MSDAIDSSGFIYAYASTVLALAISLAFIDSATVGLRFLTGKNGGLHLGLTIGSLLLDSYVDLILRDVLYG